jgi:two-component system, OmpR family, phosphate regulon sensor histidine kinase PhoR
MSSPRAWRGASRRLILSFTLVLLAPAAAVVWLGVRLVDEDRALASRQLRERRESAADRLVAGLAQALSASERRLFGGPTALAFRPGDDAVVLTLGRDAVDVSPADRLLYRPAVPPPPSEPSVEFEAGESFEFRTRDYRAAAASYRALTESRSRAVRAAALLRLGRTLRKTDRSGEALAAYADLARLHDVVVSGLPADLVARRARCALLEETGRMPELQSEARALHADLMAARWPLDRGTYIAYSEQTRRWGGADLAGDPAREALSAATEWIWQQWTEAPRNGFQTAGQRARQFGGTSITFIWAPIGDRLAVLAAGPVFQQREWFDPVRAGLGGPGLLVALADDTGQGVGLAPPADAPMTERRLSAVTGLPWTVVVGSSADADLDEIAGRRRLIFAGLALLVGLVVAGGYFIIRAVLREFAVAQLQSDFVAAVSHEFRTPLTSLRQFTDLLNDNPDFPAEKRHTFYQAQSRATERLRRLVESLLDFGRMEAGARPYRFERLPAGPLVRAVVDDFKRDATPEGFTLEPSIGTGSTEIDVDPDAFTRALWNLLDNAVKYSGSSRSISVAASVGNDAVTIAVRDGGIGIPRQEQEQIFKKFVRGSSARTHGIKGTGIGLAMVRHIVEAHGGRVRVESAPGHGSTFTIVLPGAQVPAVMSQVSSYATNPGR